MALDCRTPNGNMKAIQITQADKDNNSTYLNNSNVGDIVTFQENRFPKVWNNTIVNYNSDLEHFRFKEVIFPNLQDGEKYSEVVMVEGSFIYDIEVIQLPTDEQLQAIKKTERNELLAKGVIVSNIWFNEEKLTQFTVMAQMMNSMGVTSMEWGKEGEDGSTVWGDVEVPNEAFLIIQEASAMFSQIYKEHIL